jgi:SMI1-KNR4 cell-wall
MSNQIQTIINKHLDKWIKLGLNYLPIKVDIEMTNINIDKKDDWTIWFPIESRISDNDIIEFENKISHKLPKDYITFLQHKHFYELRISEASFFKIPVNSWEKDLSDMILDAYPPEFLIEKGFVPFADWEDWGLLCFDTTKESVDNNYPVVLWDHESPFETQIFANNFYELLVRLDEEENK